MYVCMLGEELQDNFDRYNFEQKKLIKLSKLDELYFNRKNAN